VSVDLMKVYNDKADLKKNAKILGGLIHEYQVKTTNV